MSSRVLLSRDGNLTRSLKVTGERDSGIFTLRDNLAGVGGHSGRGGRAAGAPGLSNSSPGLVGLGRAGCAGAGAAEAGGWGVGEDGRRKGNRDSVLLSTTGAGPRKGRAAKRVAAKEGAGGWAQGAGRGGEGGRRGAAHLGIPVRPPPPGRSETPATRPGTRGVGSPSESRELRRNNTHFPRPRSVTRCLRTHRPPGAVRARLPSDRPLSTGVSAEGPRVRGGEAGGVLLASSRLGPALSPGSLSPGPGLSYTVVLDTSPSVTVPRIGDHPSSLAK